MQSHMMLFGYAMTPNHPRTPERRRPIVVQAASNGTHAVPLSPALRDAHEPAPARR